MLFIFPLLDAKEAVLTADFKVFLTEYYSSFEKSQGATKIQYALLKGKRSLAIHLMESGEILNQNSSSKIPTPLMLAIGNEDDELTELMIKNGADVNYNWYYPDFYDTVSPLLLAIIKNIKSNIVLMLVKRGAIVQNTNGWGQQDALMRCISSGDSEKFFTIVKYATSPFDIRASYDTGNNLLSIYTGYPKSEKHLNSILEIDKYLIENNVSMQTSSLSALSVAISCGNMHLVRLLINSGADINHISSNINAPIISAIAYDGHFSKNKPCHDLIAKPTEALELLLELEANQDIYHQSGCSLLGYAIQLKANESVKVLLDHGSNLDALDRFGKTALCHAIENNNIGAVKLLLDYGANVRAIINNVFPAELALSKGYNDIFNLLVEFEANSYNI